MPELVGLLEKAELAIASASHLADEASTGAVATATALLRRRLEYPDDILLVALAGGTGSGKSSLLNAMAGLEIAQPGGLRPTTRQPMAVASRTSLERMGGYLSTLGISETGEADLPAWLCLVDLPDTDSVELDHRLQVDSLVTKVDLVVWVVDPQKYRDAALHNSYLRPLSDHSSRFVFALNQSDRIAADVLASIEHDFAQALEEDGIEDPTVIPTSALPPSGPPVGVDLLVEALDDRRTSGLSAKALAALQDAITALLAVVGSSGIDFEERAAASMEEASRLIATGREADAVDTLTELFDWVARVTGGVVGSRVRAIGAGVPQHVRRAIERRGPGVDDLLEERLLDPVREVLRERAACIALVTDLSISVSTARSELGA